MAFDPQAFISGSAPAQLPMQAPTENPAPVQAQPASPPQGFDPQRFIRGGQAQDPVTGEDIPLAFSGNSPETAMNKSIVSAADRARLSFGEGDAAGNIAFLKNRFADAKQIPDEHGKPTKDLAVRQGNTWYRVDPDNGSILDPWKLARSYANDMGELKKDLADLTGMGVSAATQVGVTAALLAPAAIAGVATGGAALVPSVVAANALGGLAGAAVRTSLGRVIGTYDASIPEQASDLAFESLLNAAGAKIAMGTVPTAKWVAGRLGALSEAFKDAVEPMIAAGNKKLPIDSSGGVDIASLPKTVWKKVMATASVGENSFDNMVEQPNSVGSIMSRLHDATGGKVQAYLDKAIGEQVDTIAGIAGKARQTVSDIYGNMRNKLLSKIPQNFSVNLEDSVYASYKDALEKGIGVLKVGEKTLKGPDAIEYLAKNGTGKASFRVLSPEEMQIQVAQGGKVGEGLGYLVANPEAHAAIDSFYTKLGKFAGGADRTGREGAKDLLDFKKLITDMAQTASNSPALENSYDARQIITQAKSAIDNNIFQSLKQSGTHNDFLSLNETYDTLSNQLSPLLRAQKRALGTDNRQAYEGLLNGFLSRPKPGAAAREAIDNVISIASEHGLDMHAMELSQMKNHVQLLEAAKDFNPLRPGVVKAAKIGASSAAIAAYAMNHPGYAAALAFGQIVTSPQAAKASIAAVQALSQSKQMLSQMSKKQLETLMESPQALTSLTTGILRAPLVRQQADQQLQQMLQQATQRQSQ